MFIRYFTAALSAAIAILPSAALDLQCTPGSLATSGADYSNETELRISGTVDASDLFFIGDKMTGLKTLDLSQCKIAAYKGEPLKGQSEYPASAIPFAAFAGSPITSVALPSAISVGDMAFASSALTSLVVPEGTVALGQGAFSKCPNLKEVTLTPATSGGCVFKDCTALRSVNLQGVSAVADGEFAGCAALAEVNGSEALVSIGNSAFEGCGALVSFSFGRPLKTVGAYAFARTALVMLNLESTSLSSLGDWAFAYNTALVEATLPSSLPRVGKGVFFDCPALSQVNLPAACAAIGDYALKGASGLLQLAMPQGVESIGELALKDASSLTDVKIPASVQYIGSGAMEGMTSLARIDATDLTSVPELGNDVWAGLDQADVLLSVGESTVDDFKAAPQWQEFTLRSVPTSAVGPVVDELAESSLSGYFDGRTLHLRAKGADVASVALYNAAGALLAYASPKADMVEMDTSAFDDSLFIVRCVLDGGKITTLKLARR